MDNDQEVLAFLEHFGVKGMKWGVRKKSGESSEFPEESSARKKKIVKSVAIGAGVAATAAIIAYVGSKKLSSISSEMDNLRKVSKVENLINADRKTKIDAIRKTHKEGFISKEQMENFVSSMEKRYDKKLVDALRDVT